MCDQFKWARKLIKITKKDAYPMANINNIMGSIRKAKFFTSFDIKMEYHQIEIAKKDIEKTAFLTPAGLYEFTKLSFGLCNAPATFQRLMNEILYTVLGDDVVVYLEDILIWSHDFDEHLVKLAEVVSLLNNAGLKLNIRKCMFCLKELTFLGYKITL